ncbi:fucose-binding lectin II [Photorhabdus antumapuensis]|uniref:fucose-binding lectin II n=1 Tax=Photorhabdus antumapuensis TaxID=2862867 RepID=UPI001CEC9D83|nr:fucose-binding lectin II [Photorhabdus antumapuensis]MCA6221231.1 fucose-binding lectin II [Photorhabdus antumapuensis]
MADIIKYGDTIRILNGYNNWQGGYLSTYGNNDIPGAKHSVLTVAPSFSDLGGIWRIKSGTGKAIGSEIINDDIILLHNLSFCDGGYLGYYDGPNQPVPSGEIYPIITSDINTYSPKTLEWIIYCETPYSTKENIIEGAIISLYNRWGNKGFLNSYGNANKPNTLYGVSLSGNSTRKTIKVDQWKMEKINDPCPPTNPSNCGGECGTNDTGKHCFQLPKNILFGLTAYNNTSIQQTVKVYIDDLLVDTLTGKGTINPMAIKTYTSGTGKVCIAIEGDGKPSKLRYFDNTLDGKPGTAIIGAENGTNNNYNDCVVMLNWPMV